MLVMLIERNDRGWAIRTPAKLNLFLDVLSKRADGYHEIDTVMCPISWCDDLQIELTDQGIDFSIGSTGGCNSDDPAWQIPADQTNLVVRAIQAVTQSTGYQGGWRIRLEKRVPLQPVWAEAVLMRPAAIVGGLINPTALGSCFSYAYS